jgi:acyl-ACP thioesterase
VLPIHLIQLISFTRADAASVIFFLILQVFFFFSFWIYMCSTWVMMNKKTRRFSKMPNEVRGEISPHFLERSAIDNKDLVTQKIKKLGDDSAQLVCSGLTV